MTLRRVKLVIAEAKVAQRKEQLEAGGSERFFEGGRFIDAYPVPATYMKWSIKSVF